MSDESKMYFRASDLEFYDFPIDDTAVVVSTILFANIMTKLKHGYVLKVDAHGHPYTVKRKPVPPSLEGTLHNALNQLNAMYENVCIRIRGTYPETETGTWPVQLIEALEYRKWIASGSVVDDRPEFVLLDPLSAERDLRDVGDGLEDLVNRIIANAGFYNKAIAKATAIRHQTEQAIMSAYATGDATAIEAIEIQYNEVYEYLRDLGLDIGGIVHTPEDT